MPNPPTPFPDSLKPLLPTSDDIELRCDPPTRHPDCCLSLSRRLFQTLLNHLPSSSIPEGTKQQSATILSIGSGSGLLERALQLSAINLGPRYPTDDEEPEQDHDPEFSNPPTSEPAPNPLEPVTDATPTRRPPLRIFGIEVSPTINRYLPPRSMIVVPGTWAIAGAQIRRADVLMFVYPRAANVVRRSLDEFVKGFDRGRERMKVGILLLPVVDWEDEIGETVREWADEGGVEVGEKKGWELGLMEEEMGVVLRIM